MTEQLMRIAEPVCASAGYELVDLSLTQSRVGWLVQVFIDHMHSDETSTVAGGEEASEVSLEDCEHVSRELSAVLDVEDPLPFAYNLEVSSPGLDRPLRTVAHFQRFAGHEVKVRLDGTGDATGRRNFKGRLEAVSAEAPASIVVNVDGAPHTLLIDDIESARVVPDWNAIMHRGGTKR